MQANPAAIAGDLSSHRTPEEWAKEGFDLGKKMAYEDGNLRPADDDDDPPNSAIPEVQVGYAENAGEAARYCAAKAGKRLAQTLREVLAAN